MTRTLVLCGGSPHAHDFESIRSALASLLGHKTVLVEHPDEFADRLSEGWDLTVVHALWWSMTGDAYDTWREDWGYRTSANTAEAIDRHVREGGNLLSLHTAPICFDDWPGWGDLLGGGWQWGISSHPPKGPIEIHITGEHPITEGLPETIALNDEVYGDLRMNSDTEVLAVAQRHPDDDEQPIIWTHRHGTGRVVHIGVGHDADSINHHDVRTLITRSAEWLTETATARA